MVGGGWYFLDGERQLGPLSRDELKHFLHGQDSSAVHVWREGFSEWVVATDLPELALAEASPVLAEVGTAHCEDTSGVSAIKPARFKNFIAMNWRGEFSLATSYWLFFGGRDRFCFPVG